MAAKHTVCRRIKEGTYNLTLVTKNPPFNSQEHHLQDENVV